jgi:maltose O-acetyltransferase
VVFVVIDNKSSGVPVRTEFDKMVAGEWYRYRNGPELADLTTSTQRTCRQITARYDDDQADAHALFVDLLGSVGEGVDFRPPLYLDYGSRLHVGANTFINADFLALGGGEITIGANVLVGPSARLYTPSHALDVEERRAGYERVWPIVTPGQTTTLPPSHTSSSMTIGAGSIIGAGSVVTRDVPPGVIAAGNPARVVRAIGPDDKVAPE